MTDKQLPHKVGLFSDRVQAILNKVRDMLVEKNKAYGNSALDPVRVFSGADPVEQLRVRIDDKLSRIRNKDTTEDARLDLIGYLVLEQLAMQDHEAGDGWERIPSFYKTFGIISKGDYERDPERVLARIENDRLDRHAKEALKEWMNTWAEQAYKGHGRNTLFPAPWEQKVADDGINPKKVKTYPRPERGGEGKGSL